MFALTSIIQWVNPHPHFLLRNKCISFFYEAWRMVSKCHMDAQWAARFIWLFSWLSAWESIHVLSWCLLCVCLQFSGSDKLWNEKQEMHKDVPQLWITLVPNNFRCLCVHISVLVHVFVFKTCLASLQLFSWYSLFTRVNGSVTHKWFLKTFLTKMLMQWLSCGVAIK